jgi:hypothetical protein
MLTGIVARALFLLFVACELKYDLASFVTARTLSVILRLTQQQRLRARRHLSRESASASLQSGRAGLFPTARRRNIFAARAIMVRRLLAGKRMRSGLGALRFNSRACWQGVRNFLLTAQLLQHSLSLPFKRFFAARRLQPLSRRQRRYTCSQDDRGFSVVSGSASGCNPRLPLNAFTRMTASAEG